jgi:hypothetical protein
MLKYLVMSWKEYYQTPLVICFEEQAEFYEPAFKGILDQRPNRTITTLLGGFHPANGTVEQFLEFCRTNHPNPEDRHLLLDMNDTPLSQVPKMPQVSGIQAKLDQLPLRPDSVDFAFLDFTFDFMRDHQVQDFMRGMSQILSRDGAIFTWGQSPTRDQLFIDFYDRLPTRPITTYQRYPQEMNSLIQDATVGDVFSTLVHARTSLDYFIVAAKKEGQIDLGQLNLKRRQTELLAS